MPQYAINYHTGAAPTVGQFPDLAAAKAAALDAAGYTQQNITIYDQDGQQVAQAVWIGNDADQVEPEIVLVRFGTSGYYQLWDDELVNLY